MVSQVSKFRVQTPRNEETASIAVRPLPVVWRRRGPLYIHRRALAIPARRRDVAVSYGGCRGYWAGQRSVKHETARNIRRMFHNRAGATGCDCQGPERRGANRGGMLFRSHECFIPCPMSRGTSPARPGCCGRPEDRSGIPPCSQSSWTPCVRVTRPWKRGRGAWGRVGGGSPRGLSTQCVPP